MKQITVNGLDLSIYLDHVHTNDGTLSGSNRRANLKRKLLLDLIQKLPDEVINVIWDSATNKPE